MAGIRDFFMFSRNRFPCARRGRYRLRILSLHWRKPGLLSIWPTFRLLALTRSCTTGWPVRQMSAWSRYSVDCRGRFPPCVCTPIASSCGGCAAGSDRSKTRRCATGVVFARHVKLAAGSLMPCLDCRLIYEAHEVFSQPAPKLFAWKNGSSRGRLWSSPSRRVGRILETAF